MNDQILIEPIINGKEHGFGIQGKIFTFDIKITNKARDPSSEFNISGVVLASAQGQSFTEDFNKKTLYIKKLNPDESYVINVGTFGHFMYGLITITISATSSSNAIDFFQKNPFTKDCQKAGNFWQDFIYVKSLNEYEQEKTNRWMILLTFVIAILTIVIAIPVVQQIINFFFHKT